MTTPTTVPTRRIEPGDRLDVEKQLNALPIGAVIRCDDGTKIGLVYQKLHAHLLPWYEAGMPRPCSSENIARHEAPIEVLR
ncbi:hypothetical protein GCM10007304_17940 [Rhodococcoides trifolii]|uniref:Uncharacterized protein n=1 Tax=Rhodococcoides trifolii TaxID=908250 RepID=A0A917FVD9_9NOCA|nr:hypothetical protein [Rhodococcus trifolii]GGG04238.1 hypothetical protein GCM10007304_17940 [Rhodococcus trifolii]